MEEESLSRLGQVAGTDQSDRKMTSRAVQFLSIFGIDVGPQSDQVQKLLRFVKDMPEFKGQEYSDQYQSSWKGNAGVLQNERETLSKDGSDYNVY